VLAAHRRTSGFVGALPLTRGALAYAHSAHAGQRRGADGAPFIAHPLEVALLLQEEGAPDHVIAAGVLHDVVEKSGVDGEELRDRFGDLVTELVLAVSEDDTIADFEERKTALREQVAAAGRDAWVIFAADKVSKARELRLEPPRLFAAGRITHYRDSLELLEELMPDSWLVEELRRELRAFPDARRQALSQA
jgi:(p)ppGpp synthase/HD superfamily hydrolase